MSNDEKRLIYQIANQLTPTTLAAIVADLQAAARDDGMLHPSIDLFQLCGEAAAGDDFELMVQEAAFNLAQR